MDIETEHVTLHELSYEETERILRREHPDSEVWASGYPSVEQVDFLSAFLVELRRYRPGDNWQCQLRRRADGLVIGGAGVSGPPDSRGSVVVGYEIEPTLPEDDFDTAFGVEIVRALLDVARGMGARRATTSTPRNDDDRPRAYVAAGFTETARSSGGAHFAIDL